MSRVAVWIHGGIGGGFFSQGQPPIQQLIFRLADQFEIDVYTLLPPNKDFIPRSFRIFYLNRQIQWRFLRWAFLGLKFFLVSIRNPYQLVYGFWGYPAGTIAVLLGKLYGIPSVVHLQGGDAVSIAKLKYGVFYNPVRARICRFAYSRCSALIALTHFQAGCLKDNQVLKKTIVIPFGVDTETFTYKADRFDQPLVRFLHVGNQTPVKGQEIMLKTFSKVASQIPAHLIIIGPDYFQGQLMAWCVSLGIENQVEFFGPQPHQVMAQFYHEADILLHTPHYEGQGVVFAEAAACGTLIAGTRVGMLYDMGDDCALIAGIGEADTLAAKIIATFQVPEHFKQMQLSAKQWAQKREINYTESKILEMLKELLPDTDEKTSTALPGEIER